MTTTDAPEANINARVRPSFKLTLAAVMLISPGGMIPKVDVKNPKTSGKAKAILFYFETNVRNRFVNIQILFFVKRLDSSDFRRRAGIVVDVVVGIQDFVPFAVQQS